MSNSANLYKLLTLAVIVNNLAKKIDECPQLGVIMYCLCMSFIQSSRVFAIVLRNDRDFKIVHYIVGICC